MFHVSVVLSVSASLGASVALDCVPKQGYKTVLADMWGIFSCSIISKKCHFHRLIKLFVTDITAVGFLTSFVLVFHLCIEKKRGTKR